MWCMASEALTHAGWLTNLEVVRALHRVEVAHTGPRELRDEVQIEQQHSRQHGHILYDGNSRARTLGALETA